MAHGLFDGFEGYRSVTDDDLQAAVRGWLVVLDTNVLLHLYNYQGQALEDFMRVFEALDDRLFVPHQVLDEFWRNRSTVLRENKGRHRERETIDKAFESIATDLRKWHQRAVSRQDPLPGAVEKELHEARSAVLQYLDDPSHPRSLSTDTTTQQDPVLTRLELVLQGRVGPAPSGDERTRLLEIGKGRIQRKIPPGYMDAEKGPERAIGDFLVWQQVLDESRNRAMPVLLVTQDAKEDWWADRGTAAMRARPELVAELLKYASQPLIMVRTHDLLRLGRVVGVDVQDSTLAEAMEGQGEAVGWTDELYAAYFDYLAAWPGHHAALLEALNSRGRINRDPLARLIGKSAQSAMKGTSVPYATALRRMCADYGLDVGDLEVPFKAHYTDGWMDYFFIPEPHFEALVGVAASLDEVDSLGTDGATDHLA